MQNNQKVQRYDSLNLVDEKTLNDAFSNTIKNINAKANVKTNINFEGKSYNYKDSLIKFFSNKQNLMNTNNQYEQFLNQSNNYQKNKLGISFPMNYNGLYFPWWGFGNYFYWYMSSDVYQKFYKAFGWGQPFSASAVLAFLKYVGIAAESIPLLALMLMALPASFYIDTAFQKYDDGKGIYLGISILPAPIIFEIGNQDKYISKTNSFEVDYKFCAADYMTTCIDEQGVNYLLNYYNQQNTDDFANNVLTPYLKQLTPIDHTGLGGGITNQDYTDWSQSFVQNDPFWVNKIYHSHLKDFVYFHPHFETIDIRTQRGATYSHDPSYGPYPDKDIYREYSTTWKIWINS